MATGFFTDTTVCIGCKACEVACKQWNQLPDDGYGLSGMSYDNTVELSGSTWRHVSFIERLETMSMQDAGMSWLFMSDVCKHCVDAGCLNACPTGAIIRTEFQSVYVQPDVCNGCGYCVVSCPFGVIGRQDQDGRAWKCTLCYDRQRSDMTPACAQACPTQSIQFGDLDDLRDRATRRVAALHAHGVEEAQLYGDDPTKQPGTNGLNAFFLIADKPEVYNLPPDPVAPSKYAAEAWISAAIAGAGIAVAVIASVFGGRR